MGFFTLLKYLKYAPLLESVLTDIENILKDLVGAEKKLPSPDQVKIVLDDIRKILDAGIIDIPGLDEKQLAIELQRIEELLTSNAMVGLQNLMKYGTVRPGVVGVLQPQIPAVHVDAEELAKG